MKKSYFYRIEGKLKERPYQEHVWIFHSYANMEEFSKLISDIVAEWEIISIQEIGYNDMEVIDHWDVF